MKIAFYPGFLWLLCCCPHASATDLDTNDRNFCQMLERREEGKLLSAKGAELDASEIDEIGVKLRENNPGNWEISSDNFSIQELDKADLDGDGLPENLILFTQGRAQTQSVLIYGDDWKIKSYSTDSNINSADDRVSQAELDGVYLYEKRPYLIYRSPRPLAEIIYASRIHDGQESMLCKFAYKGGQESFVKGKGAGVCRYALHGVKSYPVSALIEPLSSACFADPRGTPHCARPLRDYGSMDIDNDGQPEHVVEMEIVNFNSCNFGYDYFTILNGQGAPSKNKSSSLLGDITGQSDCDHVASNPFKYGAHWYIEKKSTNEYPDAGSFVHNVYLMKKGHAKMVCEYFMEIMRQMIPMQDEQGD